MLESYTENTIPKIQMCHSVWVYTVSSGFFSYIRGQKYRKRSLLLKSTWKGNDAHDNSLCNSTLTWDTICGGSCWHLPVLIHCQERVLACREHWDVVGHWCNITNSQITPLSRTPVFQVIGWAYRQMGHEFVQLVSPKSEQNCKKTKNKKTADTNTVPSI